MFRYMFHAEVLGGRTGEIQSTVGLDSQHLSNLIAAGDVFTVSLFRAGTARPRPDACDNDELPGLGQKLYLYYECRDQGLEPEKLFPSLGTILELWPGRTEKRRWVPLIDVYHASVPQNADHWTRKSPVGERRGKLIQIRPELLSSYIFYHFQLQEESRKTENKYCMIGMYENFLFYYDEMPPTAEILSWGGKLSTNNTPADWDSLMKPHFIPWRDMPPQHERRYPMEVLFSI